MHSDAYFVTGTAHPVCQDYALAGEKDEQPFAIVSDGCSSSPHTDIGSRLLTHAFVSEIPAFRVVRDEGLMTRVVTNAAGASIVLGLPLECLDATLLCCSIVDDPLIMAVGDGVVACKYEDGSVTAWQIEYDKSAPEYPSYRLDPKRQARFNNEFGSFKKIFKWSTSKGYTTTDMTDEFLPQFRFNLLDKPKVIAVMSDGVGTFEGIPWYDVVTALMDFKSVKGQFVQRRMKRFIKNCQKKGIAPYDDVSMAAIHLG